LAREEGLKAKQDKAERETYSAQARLSRTVERMNEDHNGTVSLEELRHSIKNDEDIATQIKVAGLSQKDLDTSC